ncbi:hypothetical protein ANCDUO_06930 [Ancylostoma duodenale]|uniref:Uncharacterized protein n=1 Tax=Ancylostoma duodenale TaxID=51022 RepID=A0A0C2D0C5_9BILA|nr:hypothetical protein ANCDUO_06930 [Ancylostoma duodenale]
MADTKRYNGIPLRPLQQQLFSTGNDVSYSYPILGKKCTVTSNFFLEIGGIMTTNGENMISNVGVIDGCKFPWGNCTEAHEVVVWEQPKGESKYCKFVKSGDSLINEAITKQQKNQWCLPNSSIPMVNGASLEFPQIAQIVANMTIREILENRPDIVQMINDQHFSDSDAMNLKRSRTTRSISALLEKPEGKADSMIFGDQKKSTDEAREVAKKRFMTMFSKQRVYRPTPRAAPRSKTLRT